MGPITKSALRTSIVLGLRLLIQAGTLLIIARMLGPSQFAAFAGIAALAVLLGTFSTFGTHLVLLAEVAKDKTHRQQVLRYAVPTTLITGSLLFFAYITAGLLFFKNIELSLSVILCIGFTETILLPLFLIPATEELALEKTARSQLLMIFPLGLRTLAAVVVMLLAVKQPLLVFAWLYLASALLALLCMKWYKPNAWLSPNEWQLANKQELKYSAGYATLALTTAGPSELDKMLAVKLLPLGVGGLYIAASRVIGAATLPVTALLLAAMPRLFRGHIESQTQSQRLNHLILGSVFIYGVILAGFLWVLAPWVEWLFGHKYQGITEILQWLCWVVPALALRISLASILMTMGKPWLRAGIEISGTFTLIIGAIILYPLLGIVGMVLALTVSEWGMAAVGYFFTFNKLIYK
ncbi:lipopolysaccharide biosynthesis protein [Acinetobacter radioresistens]|uniref:lipopolysaccharide biosynthesis protein n=1 Tax=Acinetobacter radioresistens TaxID=40216 RepID=UPI000DADEAE7|nr:oligosaccharide flippase family protein [Acinetobacter radioresistens]AWV87482.1 lipopolysaccharide biosynthesis protein [Acinetobacter radioresistens]MCX0327068.1 oligosaccharide flippase family protein [Acinetobacter radioresistens]